MNKYIVVADDEKPDICHVYREWNNKSGKRSKYFKVASFFNELGLADILAQALNEPTKICIVIEGGACTGVRSNKSEITVEIFDHDDYADGVHEEPEETAWERVEEDYPEVNY